MGDEDICIVCFEKDQEGYNFEAGFVCSHCLDNLDNKTGYCSMSCRLGYGCDESC